MPTACPALAVDLREIQPEAVALVPKALAAKHKVFPYRVRGKTLTLLMVDPSDHAAVARIGYSLGYIVTHRGRARVPDDPAPARLLRRRRALALHRHAPAGRRGRREPRGRRGRRRAHRRGAATRDEVVEALLGRVPALLPARGVLHRAASPGCWAGAAPARAWTGRWPRRSRVPLDQPSIFQHRDPRPDACSSGASGPEEENQRFLKALGKRPAVERGAAARRRCAAGS